MRSSRAGIPGGVQVAGGAPAGDGTPFGAGAPVEGSPPAGGRCCHSARVGIRPPSLSFTMSDKDCADARPAPSTHARAATESSDVRVMVSSLCGRTIFRRGRAREDREGETSWNNRLTRRRGLTLADFGPTRRPGRPRGERRRRLARPVNWAGRQSLVQRSNCVHIYYLGCSPSHNHTRY